MNQTKRVRVDESNCCNSDFLSFAKKISALKNKNRKISFSLNVAKRMSQE